MRKHKHRLSILLIVVGALCLVIGGLFVVIAVNQYAHERGRFFSLAGYFGGSGAAVLLIRYLFLVLPENIKESRSGVVSRRKDLAKLYKRPVPADPKADRKAGGILLVALILLGVISSAALYAIVSAQASEAESRSALQDEALRLAAIDTARMAMQRLADDPDLNVDHPGEPWAEFEEFTDASGTTRLFSVHDLQRAFDVNNLNVNALNGATVQPQDVAANILIQCGELRPGEKVQALKDWVDVDNEGPFESIFYASRNDAAQVPDRIVYGWGEVLQIEGWNAEMMERKPGRSSRLMFESDVMDCLSVIPVARTRMIPVNINAADPGVLYALFGFENETLVAHILNRRKAEPFRNLDPLRDIMDENLFSRVSPYLDVKSRYFHIEASAFSSGRSYRIQLLAARGDDGQVSTVEAFF